MEEKRLIEQIRQGDRQAMHTLYDLSVGRMVAICQRYLTNPEDVKDVVQETYIQVWQHIDQLREHHDGALSAWMRRIAVNRCVSLLREKRKLDFVDMGELPEVEDEPLDINLLRVEQLHQAIRQLPPGYRTVLNLYVMEQKSHREIAQLLGIGENTSASQYLRAKAQLRKILKGMT